MNAETAVLKHKDKYFREMTTDETLKLYNFKAFKKQVYSDLSYDEEQETTGMSHHLPTCAPPARGRDTCQVIAAQGSPCGLGYTRQDTSRSLRV